MWNSLGKRVLQFFLLGIVVGGFFVLPQSAFALTQRIDDIAPVSGGFPDKNIGKVLVQFAYPVSAASISNATFVLARNLGSTLSPSYSTVSASVVYSDVINGAIITPTSALDASRQYRLRVSSAGSATPGITASTAEQFFFTTKATNDATAPTVSLTNITSGFATSNPYIAVRFSEDMDPTTFTSSSVSLSPAVTGTRLFYDVRNRTLFILFSDGSLAASTAYTLTITTAVRDLAGNTLASSYTNSFTSGSASSTAPSMSWSTLIGSELRVGFNVPMNEVSVEDPSNWSLSVGGTAQLLSANQAEYNHRSKEVVFRNVNAATDASYSLSTADSLSGVSGLTLSSGVSMSGAASAEAVNRGNWSGTNTNYMSWVAPIYVWPRDSTASQETIYYVSFPLTRKLNHGSSIDIFWPASFDLTNVAAVSAAESWSNKDINGWNTPTVTISSVSVDSARLMTSVRLSVDSDSDGVGDSGATTGDSDYMSFELRSIGNSASPCERNSSTSSGGCRLKIELRLANGTLQEGPLLSNEFSVYGLGTGSISGSVVSKDNTAIGISGATIHLYGGIASVSKTATTDSSGAFSFPTLRPGWYYTWVESNNELYTNDYYSSQSINLTEANPTYTGLSIQLRSRSAIISGTLTHAASLAGTKVNISAWNQEDYGSFQKQMTLTGTSTPYSIRVTGGKTQIYVYEDYTSSGFTYTYSYKQSFVSPAPKTVNAVNSTTVSGINFFLNAANKTISGSVKDQDGNGLANVSVSAWSNNRDAMGSSAYTTTQTDGSFSFEVAVPTGLNQVTYNVYVFQYGLGQGEKEVVVREDGTTSPASVNFVFRKASSSISGKVTDDGGSALQWASLNAYDADGNKQWASADSDGKYTIFVGVGTWTIEAYAWQYGNLPCKSGSTCAGISVAENATISSVDFQYDPTSYATISGRVTDASGGVRYVSVWAERIVTATGKRNGWGNWASTDESGNFSIRVQKNTASEHYELRGWATGFGELPPHRNIDVSSGSVSGKNWDLGTIRTVTVSISNAPTSAVTGKVNFYSDSTQIGSWVNVTLASGSGTDTIQLPDDTYRVKLHLPGFGEFSPTSPASSTFALSGNTTISFSIPATVSSMTVSGTVKDGSGTAIPQARVTLYSKTTGIGTGTYTDNDGAFSLTVQAGVYQLHAQRTGYIGSEATISTAGTHSLTLTAADSSIVGTLKNTTGNAVSDGFVWAVATDGSWSGKRVSGDGTFSLDVTSGKTWTVYGMTLNGYKGSVADVSSGATSVTITASTQQVTSLATSISRSAVPSNGIVVDDIDNTGVTITAPPNLWNNSSGDNTEPGNLTVTEVPVFETNQNFDAVGDTAVEITLADSSNQSVTQFQGNLNLNLVLTKADIDAAVASGDMQYSDLSLLSNAFLDTASNTWQTLETTRKAEVKLTAASSFAAAEYGTFVTNVTSNSNFYSDYRVLLETQVDHFTIFAPVVPATAAVSSSSSVQGGGAYYASQRPSGGAAVASGEADVQAEDAVLHGAAEDAGAVSERLTTRDTSRRLALPRHWSNFSVRYLEKRGLSLLEHDGTYRPAKLLTRAQVMDLLLQAFDIVLSDGPLDLFRDVSEFDPSAAAVSTAKKRGIVRGHPDGTFRPNVTMNRAELVQVLLQAAGLAADGAARSPFADVPGASWFAKTVSRAYQEGLVRGYEEGGRRLFKPAQEVTQAEFAVVTTRLLKKQR